ncbi:MAG TPA: hypothetical protein VF516_12370 [Kofleriaceae bacterium]
MTDLDRVVLYSALYGRYEHPKPLPADLGCRAVMFVDDDEIFDEAQAAGWEAWKVADPISPADIARAQAIDPAATAGMLRHKWWKTHPVEAGSMFGAKITLWVDASLLITADRYAERCLEALGDDDWCAVPHPSRDCVYEEALFSATLARYHAGALAQQSAAYVAMGHPRHWGLFATGANVRRHTPPVVEVSHEWWKECTGRSHQDQVSLPVLFRMAQDIGLVDAGPLRWNARMPWARWWGVYEHGRMEKV